MDNYAALDRDEEGVTIAEAADGATIVGMPSLPPERTRFWKVSRDTDVSGVTRLKLVYRGGLRIIVR